MSEYEQNNVHDRFNTFLQKNELKLTSERLGILNEALATDGHFEADDLLVILKQKGRKTSRATIYRTLEILAQAGVLRKVCLGGAAIQFEKASIKPRHDHLICQKCGTKYEFFMPELLELQDKVCQNNNFKMEDYCFQIFGLCAECARGD